MKINGSKAPTDIHRPLYLKYHQKEWSNATVGLENQFTPHGLCEENRECLVETRVQAVLKVADSNSTETVRPYDVQKVIIFDIEEYL
jgi:hypothetical protein